MIRVEPNVPALNTREFFSTKATKLASNSLVVSSSTCCEGCAIDLPAIANLTSPTDRETNDKLDFLLFVGKGTTTVGTLTKIDADGTETDTIIVDNTYGDFFATGTVKTSYWGFILDWYSVANLLGFGRYKFNITVTNVAANEVHNEDSPCFLLMPYSCDNAHRTIRISTRQKGYFEGAFDYTNLSYSLDGKNVNYWPQEIRLWGRFFRSSRELISDNIVTKDRGQEQIQNQTIKVYTLKLDAIQTDPSNRIIDDMLQAPNVVVSDYNINNIEDYKSVRVLLTALGTPLITPLSRPEFYEEIELKEYFQNNVHRYR